MSSTAMFLIFLAVVLLWPVWLTVLIIFALFAVVVFDAILTKIFKMWGGK